MVVALEPLEILNNVYKIDRMIPTTARDYAETKKCETIEMSVGLQPYGIVWQKHNTHWEGLAEGIVDC